MHLDFDPKKNITLFDKLGIRSYSRALFLAKKFYSARVLFDDVFSSMLFLGGLKHSLKVKTGNGHFRQFVSKSDFFDWYLAEGAKEAIALGTEGNKASIRNGMIKFNFLGKEVKFHYYSATSLNDTARMIKENFFDEEYKMLDVKGKDVVDVGANVGDSAIYFALKGAKHVYAFEPDIKLFNAALKNVKLNGLEDNITLLNKACGNGSFVNIGGIKVRTIALDSIIKTFIEPDDHAVLKVDCEGCEYGIILNANKKTLEKFDQIVIEAHYGYLNLIKKLKSTGFKTGHTAPMPSFYSGSRGEAVYFNLVWARKDCCGL